MSLLKKLFLLVTCNLLLVTINGCGYTTHSMISNEFKTVYVEQFINKIDITKEGDTANRFKLNRPMLEQSVTQAVIDRYLWDGNLKPKKKESADLTLSGELVEFGHDALRYSSSENVDEYRVNIIVDIKLWDNKKNKLVWEEGRFTGQATYFTTGPNAKSEDSAINDAISDLARRIVERTVEQW